MQEKLPVTAIPAMLGHPCGVTGFTLKCDTAAAAVRTSNIRLWSEMH